MRPVGLEGVKQNGLVEGTSYGMGVTEIDLNETSVCGRDYAVLELGQWLPIKGGSFEGTSEDIYLNWGEGVRCCSVSYNACDSPPNPQ